MSTSNINDLFVSQLGILKNCSVFAEAFCEYYSKRAAELQQFIVDAQETTAYATGRSADKFINFACELYGKTCVFSQADLIALVEGELDSAPLYSVQGEILDYVDFTQISDILSQAYAELYGFAGFYRDLVENKSFNQASLFTKLTSQLGSVNLPGVIKSLIFSIPDGSSAGNAFTQSVTSATKFSYNGYDWEDAMYQGGDIIVGVATKITDTITGGLQEIVETIDGFKSFCTAIVSGLGLVLTNLLSMINPAILTDYEISPAGKDSIWSVPCASFRFTYDQLVDYIVRDGGDHLFDKMVVYNLNFPRTWSPSEMVLPHASLLISAGFEDAFYNLFEDSDLVTIPLGNFRIVILRQDASTFLAEFFFDSCVVALDGTVYHNPNLANGENEDFYNAYMNPYNFSALGQMNMQPSMFASYTIPDGYQGNMAWDSGYYARDQLFTNPSVAPENYRSNQIFDRIRWKNAEFTDVPNMLKNALYYSLLMATRRWGDIRAVTEDTTQQGYTVTFGTTGYININDNDFYPYNVAMIPEPKYIVQTKSQLVNEATTFVLRAVAAVAAIAIGALAVKQLPKVRKKVYGLRQTADKLGRDYAANPTEENLQAYYQANRKANRWNKIASKFGLGVGSQSTASTQDLDEITKDISDVIMGPR